MSEQWYYGQNGVQKGPVSLEAMQELVRSGQLRPDDLVWKEGMANWAPANTLAELSTAPAAVPPPPPTQTASQYPPYTPPQQPMPPGQQPLSYQPVPATEALRSKATTSMVLGICSIVPGSCVCAFVGVGLGVAAIVMSKGAAGAPNEGAARAGFICGIIGIVLSVLSMFGGVAMQMNRF